MELLNLNNHSNGLSEDIGQGQVSTSTSSGDKGIQHAFNDASISAGASLRHPI